MIEKNSCTTGKVIGRFGFTGRAMFTKFTNLLYKCLIFSSAGSNSHSVRADNSVMILFRAVKRLAITIGADKITSTDELRPEEVGD